MWALDIVPLRRAQHPLERNHIRKRLSKEQLPRPNVDTVQDTAILDLEDSVQSVTSPGVTKRLKMQAREHARTFYEEYRDLVRRLRPGFRINAISTSEFSTDVETLEHLSGCEPLACVIIAKVTSADELLRSRDALAGVRFDELIPIVESVEGVHRLPEILVAAETADVRSVVYGHYDYSADAGVWPFLDQDQQAFWASVDPLIYTIEAGGFTYVHPPYSNLGDEAGLVRVLNRLARRCQRAFGMATLSLGQTKWCARFSPDDTSRDDDLMRVDECSPEGARALAICVQEAYESGSRKGLSFSRDRKTGHFISPHEYRAALAYLRWTGT
ncbi:MAG: aldolase/citrate lyase family protein [Vicinamibacterales bacterium]|nr:aldolase/citrate lyase family protein [Vicinamibacterales bacterium]